VARASGKGGDFSKVNGRKSVLGFGVVRGWFGKLTRGEIMWFDEFLQLNYSCQFKSF